MLALPNVEQTLSSSTTCTAATRSAGRGSAAEELADVSPLTRSWSRRTTSIGTPRTHVPQRADCSSGSGRLRGFCRSSLSRAPGRGDQALRIPTELRCPARLPRLADRSGQQPRREGRGVRCNGAERWAPKGTVFCQSVKLRIGGQFRDRSERPVPVLVAVRMSSVPTAFSF
jgi:hypothetical protein